MSASAFQHRIALCSACEASSLPVGMRAGEDHGVHFTLGDPCHLTRVPERPLQVLRGRGLRLVRHQLG